MTHIVYRITYTDTPETVHMDRDYILGAFGGEYGTREDAEAALAEMESDWEPIEGMPTEYAVEEVEVDVDDEDGR